tara:strand:+ start:130 stop:546 length:417 start_codon:yes stop_codon:yes gene_type:complete
MALVQTLCSSFKQESWLAIHDLSTDTLKMALYTSAASLGADTTVYTTTEEVTGTGYTAGGVVLTNVQVVLSGTTAYVTFDNPVWPGSSFVTRGALIYNSTKANRAIAVLDFGADKTAGPNFTVQLPNPSATTALIRFA